MTDNTQPEALRLANVCSNLTRYSMEAHLIAAELRRQHTRIAELEAARFAYASEFEPNSDGYPDVGSIHANIRAMKAKLASIRAGGVQALSAAPAGWRELAARVMDALADAQDKTNSEYPEHVKCYPSWASHARWLRWHADMFRTGKPVGNGAGQPDVLAALAASPTPPAEQQATKETSGGFHVWRDISTAPKDGSRFVATGHNYGLYSEVRHTCVAQWFRGCWMEASDWNETSELKYLTHWMPLPSPPDDVAAPAEQPATTEAATPKGAATTGAPLGGVYAELPAPNLPRGGFPDLFTEGQMRDFADRTHALRMEQAAPKAAPVKACVCGEPQASGTVHRVDGPCYVAAPQQHAPKAAQYEMDKEASNVRLDIDSNSTKPEQQRDVACSLEVGQHVGNGEHQEASCRGPKDSELLKIAARNLKYFIAHAQFSSFADKRAALNCLDALAAPQQEAQEPCPSCKNSDIYACTCPFQTSHNAAPQPAPAPLSDDVAQKTWALIDELEKMRSASRDDEDWITLNARDSELRAALAAQGGK